MHSKSRRTCFEPFEKKQGFSRKKVKFFNEPLTLQEKLDSFLIERDKLVSKGYQFASLDETSFGRNVGNVYGYSPKGKQIFIRRKEKIPITKSALVVVSSSNIISKKVVIGSFNTELMMDFLMNLNLPAKTVILLDNCRFHHSWIIKEYAKIKDWILLYVPPYSPWFNPIEGVFSIIKRHYYKTMNIEESFEKVTNQHLSSFFEKSMSTKKMI